MDRKRALLVIDVQDEYFHGNMPIEHPPVSESLPNIGRAMDAAQAAGVPVVVVQHTSPAGAPAFDKGTPGWELHPEVARRPRDHYIEKFRDSVFTGTDLAGWIERKGIDTLTVSGYMTHNCDASTIYGAVHAVHAGLQVEFLSDASGALPYANQAGAASAEEIHRVLSVVFQSNFAAVVRTADWIEALRSGKAPERDNPVASNLRARESRRAA